MCLEELAGRDGRRSALCRKICDVNSPDGIDNGRVLKLFLYTEDSEQEIAAYERGWSIYPTGKQEASMNALIAYCATLPPADNWHFRAGEEPLDDPASPQGL